MVKIELDMDVVRIFNKVEKKFELKINVKESYRKPIWLYHPRLPVSVLHTVHPSISYVFAIEYAA